MRFWRIIVVRLRAFTFKVVILTSDNDCTASFTSLRFLASFCRNRMTKDHVSHTYMERKHLESDIFLGPKSNYTLRYTVPTILSLNFMLQK